MSAAEHYRKEREPLLDDDAYFLSQANPLATVDQRELEDVAIRLVDTPQVRRARTMVEFLWRAGGGRHMSDRAWADFDGMIDEYVFNTVLMAANSDPNHPKVGAFTFAPAREWFGRKVPGSRAGGPNPDNIYRQVPIDPAVGYELSGRFFEPSPRDLVLTLTDRPIFPVQAPVLDKRDLVVGADGTFAVTVGPDPAAGRPNHLQTLPKFQWLFLRDTLSDWTQVPCAMRIRRRGPSRGAPRTFDEVADVAGYLVVNDFTETYWWSAVNKALPENIMSQPGDTGALGGLQGQRTSFGRAVIADDEAMVITCTGSGATYLSLTMFDEWYRTLDPGVTVSSFTNDQCEPDGDGGFTFVVAKQDPGVHNWMDTAGLNEVFLLTRWQGLPPNPEVSIRSEIVRLDQLSAALSAEVKRVTPDERARQVERRIDEYRRRFVDC